ncbi:hypothetical protein BDW62DRAFT_203040 [Aspergillus aurantiobrunneus]
MPEHPVQRALGLPHSERLPPASTTESLHETVQSILALVPENAPGSTEVWSAGTVFIEVAGQIAFSRPSQLKLATLIEELSKADKFIYEPDEMMPAAQEAIRDSYNGPNGEDIQEWPNLSAFFAHLDAFHIFYNEPTIAI